MQQFNRKDMFGKYSTSLYIMRTICEALDKALLRILEQKISCVVT